MTAKPLALQVKFWGVRGSIPVPGQATVRYGGNTSCISLQYGDQWLILDAGTGIRELGSHLRKTAQTVHVDLFITHTHWDHIQGFPFFRPAYEPGNEVRIYGYSGAVEGLKRALLEQMKGAYFPVSMDQMSDLTFNELQIPEIPRGDVQVKWTFLNHTGTCIGYRVETPAGVVAHLSDHEWAGPQAEAMGKPEPELEKAREKDAKLVEFIRGADLVICDAQYERTEYPRRVGWGHGTIEDAIAFAYLAQVPHLILFHHDPGHDDDAMDQRLARAREIVGNSSLKVDAARDGMEITIAA